MKFFLSGPVKGVRKSYALWVESGVQFQPLVYFQKPKWIKDDAAWEKFIRGVFTAISPEGLSPEGRTALNEMLESIPVKGVRKSYTLWVESGVQFQPLVYFQKPKWIKDDAAWEKFIRGVFTAISPEGQAALNEMLESIGLSEGNSND